jgi:hypothetical protein
MMTPRNATQACRCYAVAVTSAVLSRESACLRQSLAGQCSPLCGVVVTFAGRSRTKLSAG